MKIGVTFKLRSIVISNNEGVSKHLLLSKDDYDYFNSLKARGYQIIDVPFNQVCFVERSSNDSLKDIFDDSNWL